MKGGKVFLFEFADDVEAFFDQNINVLTQLRIYIDVMYDKIEDL